MENIVEMFKQDFRYYGWVGELLDDERFNVRLGLSVLFQELKLCCPHDVQLAVPSLCKALDNDKAHVRGEAANVLRIIGNSEARLCVSKVLQDESPQVREVAKDVLEEWE